jgi:hypothetical protein
LLLLLLLLLCFCSRQFPFTVSDDLKRWSLPHLLSHSHDKPHDKTARDYYYPKKKHRLSKGYSPIGSPPNSNIAATRENNSNNPNPPPLISPITTPLPHTCVPFATGRPASGLSLSTSSLPLPMHDPGPSSSPPRESSSSGKDRFSPMVFFSGTAHEVGSLFTFTFTFLYYYYYYYFFFWMTDHSDTLEARNSVAQSITHLASSISTILRNSGTSDFLFGDTGSMYKPSHQPMIGTLC